jgi:hypothetical protein
MKQFYNLKFYLAFLFFFACIFACIMPCVSAFTVSTVDVNPSGNLPAGTPVTVTVMIDFPSAGGTETFPTGDELQMSTNLEGQHWEPVLNLDGVETHLQQNSGDSLTISGWYLSYSPGQKERLRVTLTGTIPANPSPGQDLVNIQEVDSDKNVVTAARVAMPEAPFIAPSTTSIPTKKPTATKKIFTPIATGTPTPASSLGTGAGIIASIGAALLVMKRK